MPRLGDLEHAVMTVLWDGGGPLTAKAILDALDDRDLAVTTVLTVLGRLERKGVVARERAGRAHTYRAVASRDAHVAGLIREALGSAHDPAAALVHFVSTASPQEAAALRKALDR